jgi:hypothetical protein
MNPYGLPAYFTALDKHKSRWARVGVGQQLFETGLKLGGVRLPGAIFAERYNCAGAGKIPFYCAAKVGETTDAAFTPDGRWI